MKKDHFQAYLLKGANFTGKWEFPKLRPCHEVPEKLIPFSKTKGKKKFNQFVHFYELDEKILPFGNHPRKYFRRLSNFKGVIGPDFSVYRDMPLFMQFGQVYKNCVLTFWLQSCNLTVVPNVRFSDERSYEFCFEGIPQNSVISIGTHGWAKEKNDIYYQIEGVKKTIKRLKPECILFYGALKNEIKFLLNLEKVPYVIYSSHTSEVFRSKKEKSEKSYSLFEEHDKRSA